MNIQLPKLTQEELTNLTHKTNLQPVVLIMVTFASIFLVFVIYTLYPSIFIFIIGFILIAGLQHQLFNIQHEAVHKNLFSNKFINDLAGSFIAFTIFFTMSYRTHHLGHHKYLGKDGDTDLDKYIDYPNSLKFFLTDLLKCLTGISAVTQFLKSNVFSSKKINLNKKAFDWQIIGILVTQAIFFSLLWKYSSPHTYFLLWILPLLTLTKTLSHFRNVAEHILLNDKGDPETSRYRTIIGNPIETFFFAPVNFNYHAEHHLYVTIPYYNLPKVHKILSKQQEYKRNIDLEYGYLNFIFSKVIQKKI